MFIRTWVNVTPHMDDSVSGLKRRRIGASSTHAWGS